MSDHMELFAINISLTTSNYLDRCTKDLMSLKNQNGPIVVL